MMRPRNRDQKTTPIDSLRFFCRQPFRRTLCLCSLIKTVFFFYMKTAFRYDLSQESEGETGLNPGSHTETPICFKAIRA